MKTAIFAKGAIAFLLGLAWLVSPPPALAAHDIHCKMQFQLSGWSAFYKRAEGGGTVTCDNGQSMHVHIRAAA
jgi:hypothetical protein